VLAALGAGGLSALAGCNSEEPTTGTVSATPASSPTPSAEATATPAETGFPPGTNEAGIDDVPALVWATQSALRATDYAIASAVPLGGTATATVTIRSSLAQERHLYALDAPAETNRRYVADGTAHLQATAGDETTYSSQSAEPFDTLHEDNDQIGMLGSGEGLCGILRAGSYTPDGTVTRDGRGLHRFALESADLFNDATVVTGEGGASVDGDGVVFAAAIPYVPEGADAAVELSFTIETLGEVSVDEPDWVRSE